MAKESNYNEEEVNDILKINQENIIFNGERLVINNHVKANLDNVYQEHIERYKFACKYVQGKKVLDAACGAGYGSRMLSVAGAESVTGVDISLDSVHAARETYSADNITFLQGDVTNLVFEDESFDVVVSFETIEHIKSGSLLVEESSRVLKKGGIFLVSTPNRTVTNPATYSFERPRNKHHQFEYNPIEFAGDLLDKYDIVGLYGQTIYNNTANFEIQQLRNFKGLPKLSSQLFIDNCGYSLIPFKKLVNADPMYMVAVCRKK